MTAHTGILLRPPGGPGRLSLKPTALQALLTESRVAQGAQNVPGKLAPDEVMGSGFDSFSEEEDPYWPPRPKTPDAGAYGS